MKSYLCVGGPLAGQKYDAPGNNFKVPIQESASTSEIYDNVVIKTITYIEETFRTHQGDITFWIPQGQTWFDTMILLLDGYELTNAAITEVSRLKNKPAKKEK